MMPSATFTILRLLLDDPEEEAEKLDIEQPDPAEIVEEEVEIDVEETADDAAEEPEAPQED